MEVAVTLDGVLARIEREAEGHGELADSFGDGDRFEHVAGLGFVLLQQYCVVIAVDSKGARPPRADVVHCAANYWKHHADWPQVIEGDRVVYDTSPGGSKREQAFVEQRKRTIEGLRAIEVDAHAEYPMSCTLQKLAGDGPGRFERLVSQLSEWRSRGQQSMW